MHVITLWKVSKNATPSSAWDKEGLGPCAFFLLALFFFTGAGMSIRILCNYFSDYWSKFCSLAKSSFSASYCFMISYYRLYSSRASSISLVNSSCNYGKINYSSSSFFISESFVMQLSIRLIFLSLISHLFLFLLSSFWSSARSRLKSYNLAFRKSRFFSCEIILHFSLPSCCIRVLCIFSCLSKFDFCLFLISSAFLRHFFSAIVILIN